MPTTVVIPTRPATRRVAVNKVNSILSNRVKDNEEQFLVQWESPDAAPNKPPLSWHGLNELARCLEHLQDYLDDRPELMKTTTSHAQLSKKRKTPDSEGEVERRLSPFHRNQDQTYRNRPVVRSSSVSPTPSTPAIDVYNGTLDTDSNGFILCRYASGPDIAEININSLPTLDMIQEARRSKVTNAERMIRSRYEYQLNRVPGKRIHLVNIYDTSTPSLRFRYIPEYVLGEGVIKADPATQEGCQQCSPHMGRDIGCEYTKKCSCLEYAAVDESRITDPEMIVQYEEAVATGGSLMGFPKKFPYFAEGTKIQRAGCLVPFYLHSRRAIYECNDNCNCGPRCRNKNVQFGRTVELEIFKTGNGRGWGLRCKDDLHEGQFIDTYRGEIITDAEATRREKAGSLTKASYLYSLDKFAESEGLATDEIYVVDGEFVGGPTKFMNHSCQPNCRQYTVSYNKHDPRVYDLAFFACRYIPAGEELTFDYLDAEDNEEDSQEREDPGEGAVPCLCGAPGCRKFLWV